jgi:hypothetical protein
MRNGAITAMGPLGLLRNEKAFSAYEAAPIGGADHDVRSGEIQADLNPVIAEREVSPFGGCKMILGIVTAYRDRYGSRQKSISKVPTILRSAAENSP